MCVIYQAFSVLDEHMSAGSWVKTAMSAVHGRVDVVVEQRFGDFGMTRDILLGSMDGKATYTQYRTDDQRFFRSLKAVIKERTRARNIFIAKDDSLFSVDDEVLRLGIAFHGAANSKYVAIAFNGGGFLDRRGKSGGHKNWSMRGFYQREGMYIDFHDVAYAEKHQMEEACGDGVCPVSPDFGLRLP